MKPNFLGALFIEGKKDSHHAHSQLTHNRWHYPISRVTIPMEPEDTASGGFLRIDDSLGRLCIHNPLHFNRGDAVEAP